MCCCWQLHGATNVSPDCPGWFHPVHLLSGHLKENRNSQAHITAERWGTAFSFSVHYDFKIILIWRIQNLYIRLYNIKSHHLIDLKCFIHLKHETVKCSPVPSCIFQYTHFHLLFSHSFMLGLWFMTLPFSFWGWRFVRFVFHLIRNTI